MFGRFDPEIDDFAAFTINPDGTHEFALLPGLPGECPGWSPDGSKISVPAVTDGQLTVATVNADGTGFTLLGPAPNPLLNLGCSTWSPDGTRLAVEGFNDEHAELKGIYTERSSDGGDLVRVTDNPFDDNDIVGDYSPDGTQISFAEGNQASAESRSPCSWLTRRAPAFGSSLHSAWLGTFRPVGHQTGRRSSSITAGGRSSPSR